MQLHGAEIITFADWNDIISGFLEGDLVAPCGDGSDGALTSLLHTDPNTY